jgi:hypothetical protein
MKRIIMEMYLKEDNGYIIVITTEDPINLELEILDWCKENILSENWYKIEYTADNWYFITKIFIYSKSDAMLFKLFWM